jgi:hypothetical protein
MRRTIEREPRVFDGIAHPLTKTTDGEAFAVRRGNDRNMIALCHRTTSSGSIPVEVTAPDGPGTVRI